MDISSVSSSTLRSLVSQIEKRDRLSAQLEKVNASIASALANAAKTQKASVKNEKRGRVAVVAKAPEKRKKSGKRGALKEKILAELKAAGKAGVKVKEMSAKLGVKSPNVYVWFATTGTALGVKKIAPGQYRL